MSRFLIYGLLQLLSFELFAQVKQPVDYVNPFIGASTNVDRTGNGLGKTFPGAATPFGMTQVSPNTITGGDNGSGYSYEHKTIEGFAFTQMSGVGWYGDLGNFLVMPTTGKLKTFAGKEGDAENGYRSNYDKRTEKASAGYYSVTLTDNNIFSEATVTPHCGVLRFTFPKSDQSRIQIDLARRVGGTSVLQYVKVVNENTIEGWMKCTPDGGGWGNGGGNANYTVFFYAQFSKPLKKYGVWSADIPANWKRKLEDVTSEKYRQRVADAEVTENINEKEGKHLGFYTEFETNVNEQVILKTGISFVSINNARENLLTEIPHWDFDKVRAQAKTLWNKALSKINVEGGTTEEKTVFYTALYHTMIDPRCFADVNGQYPGGDGVIHASGKFNKRTIFSGWDVFRSQMPLQTIINPDVVNDMINSLVELADENGTRYLERWEFLNAYSGCMIGNPAVAMIVDAYKKGIKDFDVPKAYGIMKNTVEKFGNGNKGYATDGYSISSTLEYAYFDWCVAQMAKELGIKEDEDLYMRRSAAYKNVFDKEKGWFRAVTNKGEWEEWPAEGRMKEWYGCVECNPYQQGWFVPHDVEGMVKLMGGRDKVLRDLTDMFDKTPKDFAWNGYYNHANEPVHHVPFLFNRLGAPSLTQKWTRIICENAYKNEVEKGLIGNEDVGQMSAWYVLAASGIHPVCPGDNRYEITSPVFKKIKIRLDKTHAKAKTFTIIARGNSTENIYIQSMKLNGKQYTKWYITHDDIIKGGVLELEMGKEPVMDSMYRNADGF